MITNDFRAATLLYYILFLPGIVLHELSLWLVAGILNVHADRAIAFPEQQEIGELRLNFIRLTPGTSPFKLAIITTAPMVAGIAALWAIGVHILNVETILTMAASGTVDDLARSLTSLTSTPDFWLWFYLAFVVANTMIPSLPVQLRRRHKVALSLFAAALLLVGWKVASATALASALPIEELLGTLIGVTVQITAMNLLVVMILGAIESSIERITGKSATFRDGKMITMSRVEALALRQSQRHKRMNSREKPPPAAAAKAITSLYDLKLPIPGPPGREPISRSAVQVLNIGDAATDSGRPQPGKLRAQVHSAGANRATLTGSAASGAKAIAG